MFRTGEQPLGRDFKIKSPNLPVTRKVVYLDQKIWGQIKETKDGERSSDYEKALEKLRTLVNKDKIICPISVSRLVESLRYQERRFREDMMELMLEFSGNYAIPPYYTVRNLECLNYILFKNGLEPLDMQELIVREGIVNIGGDYDITGEVSQEDREMLLDMVREEWVSRTVMKSKDFLEYDDHITEEDKERYRQEIEEARRKGREDFDTDEEMRKSWIASEFQTEILDKLTCFNEPLDSSLNHILWQDISNLDFDMFYAQFPSFYTRMQLTIARDTDWDRPVEFNDNADIMSISTSLPYVDLVGVEDYFGGKIYSKKLNKIYNTKVAIDLTDIPEKL